VARVLELTQLAQPDREPEVDFRAGGVDAVLDPQRPAGLLRLLDLGTELGLGLEAVDAAEQRAIG
jgi:hypothetical protein